VDLKYYYEAICDFNKVTKLRSKCSDAYKNRGIYMYGERYDSALKDLNKAMELDSNNDAYLTIRNIKNKQLSNEEESDYLDNYGSKDKFIKRLKTVKDSIGEIEMITEPGLITEEL
jgi:tetratricopeptide (TPR) repeat protein